ncbi:MAG: anti-sigma factor RsbA family regulatory protein [Acidimicrobiia bacterium]
MTTAVARGRSALFHHDALLYAGDDEFLSRMTSFIEDGLQADEPILVMVGTAKIDRLRQALDRRADRVQFADMEVVGANPARIIPAWHEFADQHTDAPRLRGIGEPIWPGRSAAQLAECHIHESLLNLAFARASGFWLLCPYDTTALDHAVIEDAYRSHPVATEDGVPRQSPWYRDPETSTGLFTGLPPAPEQALLVEFTRPAAARRLVERFAIDNGLGHQQTEDLVLTVSELATNSIRHGDGRGTLRVWLDDGAVLCEVEDRGHISAPLVGRLRPSVHVDTGRGLWLANQLCDLVQIRSSPERTNVRVHQHIW